MASEPMRDDALPFLRVAGYVLTDHHENPGLDWPATEREQVLVDCGLLEAFVPTDARIADCGAGCVCAQYTPRPPVCYATTALGRRALLAAGVIDADGREIPLVAEQADAPPRSHTPIADEEDRQ